MELKLAEENSNALHAGVASSLVTLATLSSEDLFDYIPGISTINHTIS